MVFVAGKSGVCWWFVAGCSFLLYWSCAKETEMRIFLLGITCIWYQARSLSRHDSVWFLQFGKGIVGVRNC